MVKGTAWDEANTDDRRYAFVRYPTLQAVLASVCGSFKGVKLDVSSSLSIRVHPG